MTRIKITFWALCIGLTALWLAADPILSHTAPFAQTQLSLINYTGIIAMGVISATFGGILRDVFASEPSVLLRREIYLTAALLAASVHVVLRQMGLAAAVAAGAAFLCGFVLRAGAIRWGWSLPGFESRGG